MNCQEEAVSSGFPTRQTLLDLAKQLRHAVPAHAPMELAERVQHAIVKLEICAARDPVPDADSEHAFNVGEALLKTCATLFT
jgi:hypothetical protein